MSSRSALCLWDTEGTPGGMVDAVAPKGTVVGMELDAGGVTIQSVDQVIVTKNAFERKKLVEEP